MNPTVAALNSLSIFGAHQAGAYREHAEATTAVLGPGIPTRVSSYVEAWGAEGPDGVLVLTGNAGTGKTALAQAWCTAVDGLPLPSEDGLEAIVPDERWVVKDLSGVLPADRPDAIELAANIADGTATGQLFLCANEGLLRETLTGGGQQELIGLLDDALIHGAAGHDRGSVTVLNMNRQRWTSPELWASLLDYLTREELWKACESCPGHPCPISANAAALREPAPREALRVLVQLASGSTVATLRELLSILALGITGGLTCEQAAQAPAPDAEFGYFNLLFGSNLAPERVERSGLLQAMREADVGGAADLVVDGWLRDSGAAPQEIRRLAEGEDVHAQVNTRFDVMSFSRLGETITVSDDENAVSLCLKDFAEGKNALSLWRRRVFFEGQSAVGGERGALHRLTVFSFFADLLELAQALRDGHEPAEERRRLITGLNYLAAGFHAYPGALVVPDPGSLSARNPGAFRKPDPSVVHHDIPVAEVELRLEDGDQLRSMLDTDDVRVLLDIRTTSRQHAQLLLTPRLYQAIRESNDYRAPIGADIPEMAELALFYAALAEAAPQERLRIVDPNNKVIKDVTLPDLSTV